MSRAGRTVLRVGPGAIPVEPVLRRLRAPGFGAEAVFLGVVRDRNEGRRVLAVSYEAHAPLAVSVFAELARTARRRWGPLSVGLLHRTGRLKVGEASVLVAAFAPHRAEAFAACRWLIDALKERAPVWKKEHDVRGESRWLEGYRLQPR